jgi:hypothetical protein
VTGLGVEVGGRLVQQEQVRLATERHCDEELLLLAAGELAERLPAHLLRVESELLRHALQGGDRCAAQVRRETQQLSHRHLEGRRELGNEAGALQHGAARRARRSSVDRDPSLVAVLAQQAAHERRLARTVGAHQGDALTALEREAHVAEDMGAPEALREVLDPDHAAALQSSLSRPLTWNRSESVGQMSTHRPQRVQSGPTSILA